MTFKIAKEFNLKDWDNFISNSSLNLNYFQYFIEYETISYSLTNQSFLVYEKNEIVMAVLVLLKENLDLWRLNIIYSKSIDNLEMQIKLSNFVKNHLHACSIDVSKNQICNWGDGLIDRLPKKVIGNIYLINLANSKESMFNNLSRNHQRTIRKSLEIGLKFQVFDASSNLSELRDYFDGYKRSHIEQSGRQTRPDQSFEYMLDLIAQGKSKLYCVSLNDNNLAYLYCDLFESLSRGWSQVTNKNIYPDIFPRTYLEWEALLDLKSSGCKTYLLGTEDFDSKKVEIPVGINQYKIRFHPQILNNYSYTFSYDA